MEGFINSISNFLGSNYTVISSNLPVIVLIAALIMVVLIVVFTIVVLKGRSKKGKQDNPRETATQYKQDAPEETAQQ